MSAYYLELDRVSVSLEAQVAFAPETSDPLVLIVEDGSGVPGANSYVSIEYARSYFIGRRLYSSAWTVASRETQEIALRMASVVLDAEFSWSGTLPVNSAQGLAWPFQDAVDRYGNAVVGVPKALKDAVCETALWLLAQDRLVDAQGNGLKSLKVDVITLVFDKTETPTTFPPIVSRLLYGLGAIIKSTTIRNIKLFRV